MVINFIPLNPVWLMPQNQLNNVRPQEEVMPTTNEGAGKLGNDFGQFLSEAWNRVNELQKTGEAASIALATNQVEDIHTVMVALEKASVSLSMTVEVRNKVIEAYQEITRMQI